MTSKIRVTEYSSVNVELTNLTPAIKDRHLQSISYYYEAYLQSSYKVKCVTFALQPRTSSRKQETCTILKEPESEKLTVKVI